MTKTIRAAAAAFLAMGLLAGCGLNLMPSKDAWYTQHYFILQDYERDAYKDLSAAGKTAFREIFWQARQPVAKGRFDERLDFIMSQYKNENNAQPWNTDRARIYLLNGPPASISYRANDAWGSTVREGGGVNTSADRSGEDIQASTLEVWMYPYRQFFVYYGFAFQPPSRWNQAQITFADSRHLGELESSNRTRFFGPEDEEAYKARLEELKSLK